MMKLQNEIWKSFFSLGLGKTVSIRMNGIIQVQSEAGGILLGPVRKEKDSTPVLTLLDSCAGRGLRFMLWAENQT